MFFQTSTRIVIVLDITHNEWLMEGQLCWCNWMKDTSHPTELMWRQRAAFCKGQPDECPVCVDGLSIKQTCNESHHEKNSFTKLWAPVCVNRLCNDGSAKRKGTLRNRLHMNAILQFYFLSPDLPLKLHPNHDAISLGDTVVAKDAPAPTGNPLELWRSPGAFLTVQALKKFSFFDALLFCCVITMSIFIGFDKQVHQRPHSIAWGEREVMVLELMWIFLDQSMNSIAEGFPSELWQVLRQGKSGQVKGWH